MVGQFMGKLVEEYAHEISHLLATICVCVAEYCTVFVDDILFCYFLFQVVMG
jgi:hypothetical protein